MLLTIFLSRKALFFIHSEEMEQKNFTDTTVRDEQVKRINELTGFDDSLARR